jgi:hypothetical protein
MSDHPNNDAADIAARDAAQAKVKADQEANTQRQQQAAAERQRVAREAQQGQAQQTAGVGGAAPRPAAAAPAPQRSEADLKAERDARIAASFGAQVVLDPMSDVALAARGALHGSMEENVQARDKALVERAGEPVVVTQAVIRDPVTDPENDQVLAARGVAPPKPADSPKP